MPRKAIKAESAQSPTPPPQPTGREQDKLYGQAWNAWHRCMCLINQLQLPERTKQEMAEYVRTIFCCLDNRYRIEMAELCSSLDWFATRLAKHRQGPRLKQQKIQERNIEIGKAISSGITGGEAILRYLQEHHPDLVRKGRKDCISSKQMMRLYRTRKKA